MKQLIISVLVGISLFTWSCSGDKSPDVAQVVINSNSHDFYKDFSQLDTNNLSASLQSLQEKYPNYWSFFINNIAVGTVAKQDSSINYEGIKYFLTQKDYRHLMDTVNMAFANTEDIFKEIKQTFQYIKHYDSTIEIPQDVYFTVTGLSNMVVLGPNNDITVGLDFYLGEQFAPYYQIQIPDFLTRRFVKEYIPINVAQSIYLDKYPNVPYDKDLLDLMVEQGKQQYFLSLVTPFTKEYMRFGFSEAQMKWCEGNERDIYTFFQTKGRLYSKDLHDVLRYVQDGPFSSGMPQESPGNTGSFIGYKIVKEYAVQTGATLHEILLEKDAKKILQLAKYKP